MTKPKKITRDKTSSQRQKPKRKQVAEKPASPPEKTIKFVATEQIHKLIPDPMVKHLFGRILAFMRSRGTDYPTESEEGFGTLAFGAMKPRNTAEVLLCSQMVATWEVAMGMLTAAKLADDYQALTEKGNLACKLLSIFERQFATLTRARRPPQVVTVEHVHKHLHVNQVPGPTGEVTIIGGQPYEGTTPATLQLQQHPRCLARRRKSHFLCQAPAMKNGRCRIHGGASPGAPSGERNGMWRHGRYSRQYLEMRRAIRILLREARKTVATF